MPGGNVEYTYVETYYLRTFDASGAEGEKIDLSAMFAEENEYFYVSNFTVDGDGNIYMMVNGAIMVIGADGSSVYLSKLVAGDRVQLFGSYSGAKFVATLVLKL